MLLGVVRATIGANTTEPHSDGIQEMARDVVHWFTTPYHITTPKRRNLTETTTLPLMGTLEYYVVFQGQLFIARHQYNAAP